MGFASRDSHSPKRQRFESRDSDSPRRQHSSRASSREASVERPQSRSSPTHPSSPSREDKEAEDTSMPAPVRAMIDFILQSFPEATASPAHPSSRSFDLSASAGFTDAATPSGSLLAWCHVMSERNKVPDFRYLPISIKEGIAIETSLRSCLESHNFLTWSVMALIRSLYEKKLLPKDDPVISQLQKSLSKVCGSVASASSSNAPFVTLKRRQLVCGVCLLCDS